MVLLGTPSELRTFLRFCTSIFPLLTNSTCSDMHQICKSFGKVVECPQYGHPLQLSSTGKYLTLMHSLQKMSPHPPRTDKFGLLNDASYWCKGFLQPQPPFQPYKPLLQLLCLNLCPSYVRKAKENKRAIEGFLDNKLDPPASKKNKNSS
jgi:hypothetical protein